MIKIHIPLWQSLRLIKFNIPLNWFNISRERNRRKPLYWSYKTKTVTRKHFRNEYLGKFNVTVYKRIKAYIDKSTGIDAKFLKEILRRDPTMKNYIYTKRQLNGK